MTPPDEEELRRRLEELNARPNRPFEPAPPPLDVQARARELSKKARTADRGQKFVHRCWNCSHEQHARCQGHPLGPPGQVCRCRSCWRAWVLAKWAEVREGNDVATIRLLCDAFASMHTQTERRNISYAQRKQRNARRLQCVHCLRPVTVFRAVREGPFCVDRSTCRVANRKLRVRLAAQGFEVNSVTAGKIHRKEIPYPDQYTPPGPGRPRKSLPITEVDAAARAAFAPNAQLNRQLQRAEEAQTPSERAVDEEGRLRPGGLG